VTAMKANGISLYRISLPVLVMAGAVSVVAYLLLDFVLPYSNQKLAFLRNVIKGKETAQTFNAEQKRWIFGKGRYLFNFLKYDEATRTLSDVQVVELAPNGFRIRRRISADEARFDGTGWIFYGGWMRTFAEDGSHVFFEIREPVRMPYPERPEYFKLEVKSPGQMTYRELRSYISDLRRSGYESEELLVELYRKTSWPFLSLVMAIIALPFSFRMGKQGALYGVGIALGLAFIYYMAFGIFTKLGEAGNLPAILAAWSANVLFVLAAVYMFLRVET
jgi:LPS export ABC transporter permease LptG